MRPSFNVLTEPWIGVVSEEGTAETLGIRETLLRAHELRSISDVSPLTEYGIHRLLSLFLMDALRPEDITDLEDLLDEGRFSEAAVDAYIELCRSEGVSFDLFDEERPFLQSAYDLAYDKEKKAVCTLDFAKPSGHKHLHFCHDKPTEVSYPVEELPKLLITAQLFSGQGGRGYTLIHQKNAPYFALVCGKTLFETLIFSMTPLNIISNFDTLPVIWRDKEPIIPVTVPDPSWLSLMLFPTRRMHLLPDEDGVVREIYYSPGRNITEETKSFWHDPAVTYITDKKKGTTSPLLPSYIEPFWTNFTSHLRFAGDYMPSFLEHYHKLAHGSMAEITLYGQARDKASIFAEMRHQVRLPISYLSEPVRFEWLEYCIQLVDSLQEALEIAIIRISCPEDKAKNKKGKKPKYKFTDKAKSSFFSESELTLQSYCIKMGECEWTELPVFQQECFSEVSKIALSCFDNILFTMNLRGRELAKAAEAQKSLYIAINKLKKGAEQ